MIIFKQFKINSNVNNNNNINGQINNNNDYSTITIEGINQMQRDNTKINFKTEFPGSIIINPLSARDVDAQLVSNNNMNIAINTIDNSKIGN